MFILNVKVNAILQSNKQVTPAFYVSVLCLVYTYAGKGARNFEGHAIFFDRRSDANDKHLYCLLLSCCFW